jgi:hypothetical protein
MTTSLAAGILLAYPLVAFVASGETGQGPAKDVPELQPLNHYVGSFETEMTIKPNPGLPNGARTRGKATGEWILDGRFMRQTWTAEAAEGIPRLSGVTLMTYDPRQRTYRSWIFYSNGASGESQGAWNAQTRTMTWTMRDAESGGTVVTTATFAEGGDETWSIVEKDRDGKVRSEITGKTRRVTK